MKEQWKAIMKDKLTYWNFLPEAIMGVSVNAQNNTDSEYVKSIEM